MFYDSRASIAKTLEELRFDVCCYMSRDFCDCKYGYESHKQLFMENHKTGSQRSFYPGEETGCPELRTVIGLLNLMTDEEYDAILKRVPHNVSLGDLRASLSGTSDGE